MGQSSQKPCSGSACHVLQVLLDGWRAFPAVRWRGSLLEVGSPPRHAWGQCTFNWRQPFALNPALPALLPCCHHPRSFSGTVTFQYTIEDSNGKQDTATVTLVVPPPPTPMAPVTVNYTAKFNTDFKGPASLLANISSANPGANITVLGLISKPPAAVGEVVVSPDGSFVFKPAANWSGEHHWSRGVTLGLCRV